MPVDTNVLAARLAAAGGPAPARRITGRRWTPEQLHALAAKDRGVQQHVEHHAARTAMAAHFHAVDTAALRTLVTTTMGTTSGTHWMVAALHLAQLALTHHRLLTPVQFNLLLAPLEAAEAAAPTPQPHTHPITVP